MDKKNDKTQETFNLSNVGEIIWVENDPKFLKFENENEEPYYLVR
jgi:hypothetical protein